MNVTPTRRVGLNGARGRLLIAVGLIHIGIGLYVYVLRDVQAGDLATAGIAGPLPVLRQLRVPVEFASAAWWATGFIAFAAAFVRPPGKDGFGFAWLVGMETAWAVLYVLGWILDLGTQGTWALAATFACVAYSVGTVAGMVDAKAVQDITRERARGNGEHT